MRRFLRLIQLVPAPIALAAVLTVAAPAKAAPGDWWQFGYTAANTRFNPNETTIGPSNVGRLRIGARQTPLVGVPGSSPAVDATGVAVANSHAYVNAWGGEGTSGTLIAYRVNGLQEAWRSAPAVTAPRQRCIWASSCWGALRVAHLATTAACTRSTALPASGCGTARG